MGELSNEEKEKYMLLAIEESLKSKSKKNYDPKVGAVVVKDGELVNLAHRGEKGEGDHAEFTVIQKKIRTKDNLNGAEIFTTLEPCTTRSHDKLPCVEWIIQKKFKKVYIGLLDPNPNICGKGYWKLIEAKIPIEFFPPSLVSKIIDENKQFISIHRGDTEIHSKLASFLKEHKSRIISPYPALGWDGAISIQNCPNMREGWPMDQIELILDNSYFKIPEEYIKSYSEYFKHYYHKKRFFDDRDKFMITSNPTNFSDTPTLKINVNKTKYSVVQYYLNNVYEDSAKRDSYIADLLGSPQLRANFAHSFCMHMVVVTKDQKILLTKRSPKVAYYPNMWSASIEEQLSTDDFKDSPQKTVVHWGKRLLLEELDIDQDGYLRDNLRVLAVFLETPNLNVSLCAFIELNHKAKELDQIMAAGKRTDDEFSEWDYLDFQLEDLLKELRYPSKIYHPTSGYRILLSLIKRFGSKEIELILP